MLQSEFIKRTSYYPTYDEYKALEDMYNSFKGNKDEFCEQFVKNKDAMLVQAREIAVRNMAKEREKWMHERGGLQSKCEDLKRTHEYEVKRYEGIIAQLKADAEVEHGTHKKTLAEQANVIKIYEENSDKMYRRQCELERQVAAFKEVIKVVNQN